MWFVCLCSILFLFISFIIENEMIFSLLRLIDFTLELAFHLDHWSRCESISFACFAKISIVVIAHQSMIKTHTHIHTHTYSIKSIDIRWSKWSFNQSLIGDQERESRISKKKKKKKIDKKTQSRERERWWETELISLVARESSES